MGRTIDADLLKAAFEMDGYKSPYIERMIDSCPTVGEWISVKDRLPEEDGRYITYRAGINYGITCETLFCVQPTNYRIPTKNYFYFRNSMGYQCVCTDVTHWMPLPEPPKGE